MGDLENCPQPAPSVTGSGENPGQGAALRRVVVLYLPLVSVVVAARRGCIFVYRGRPSTPLDGWSCYNNDNASTCCGHFPCEPGWMAGPPYAVGLQRLHC